MVSALGFNAMIFEGSQLLRITFAREDRFQNSQPGDASQVADDIMDLEIHLRQRLLQVLHMAAGITGEVGPVAQQRTHGADMFGWTEAGAQQADGVEILNPLTVAEVGLAAGQVFAMAGVNQKNFESGGFEDLKERNPIDAGGLHGDGLNATSFEPVTQLKQIVGESGKGSNRVGVGVARDGHLNLRGADVDAGSVRMEHGQLGVGFGFYFFADGPRFAFDKVDGGRAAPSV